MRRLTQEEVKTFADYLCFTEQEAYEITELFFNEKERGNYRMKYTELETLDDYIHEWECDWYRYSSWEQLVESENEQNEGLTEEDLEKLKGFAVFFLSTGMIVQAVV